MSVLSPSPSTIVLVEDDEAVRSALTFTLQLEGWTVIGLASGEALLEMAFPAGPTCLVLDQLLEGISGLDALSALRERAVMAPAILITTHPPAAVRRRALSLGATLIEKPLLSDRLLATIRRDLAA